MSSGKNIGEISMTNKNECQWTIVDIFLYTKEGESCTSPRFDAWGSRWYLECFPNGETRCDSVRWLSLYLQRDEASAPPQRVYFNFTVKRADGSVENPKPDLTWVFDGKGKGYGRPRFRDRSQLRSELGPTDALTLICTLWMDKGDELPARTDALSRDLLDMFLSKRGCDATLKVKQVEFPVHKSILAARSPVFAAMFEADMMEKQTGIVDIPDCDPVAFEDFLTYLYSDKTENLPGNAFELFRIADKYSVKDLRSTCLVYIMGNLSPENVCDAIGLGHEFSEDGLKRKTQDFFNDYFDFIVSTPRWESFLISDCLLANALLKKMAAEKISRKRSLSPE